MKHNFFKKATMVIVTVAMLAGTVGAAFAAEVPDSYYLEETTTVGGVAEDSTEEDDLGTGSTEEDSTEEDVLGKGSTEEDSTEEDALGKGSTEEDGTKEDKQEAKSTMEKWASWTEWNNETFREYLKDALFWTEEETAVYEQQVTQESQASLEEFTDKLELADFEEIFQTKVDPENPWGMLEVFMSVTYAERNPGNGYWQADDNGMYYINPDGSKATGWLALTENSWYYLNKGGYRQTGWQKVDGTWYYFSSLGIMKSDGWGYIDDEVYHFAKSGAMQTGWHFLDGNWYYFKTSGAMATEWQKVGGVWYYLSDDGTMVTGWKKIDGIWYYLKSSGAMATGWEKVDGTWYYLTGSGAMKTGWLQDGGSWYYMDASGAMQTDWELIGTNWFYFYSNGVMAADTIIDNCYVDKNGYYVSAFLTDAEIAGKLAYLKTKYPQGAYWNHMGIAVSTDTDTSEMLTGTPCNHYLYGVDYCNSYLVTNANLGGYKAILGYQCAGFAFKLSDEIFGASAERNYYSYNFDSIRVGDTIRTGDVVGMNGHSFVVTEKYQNSIKVAECNAGSTCKITWNRIITRNELNSEYQVTCETRRP